MRTTTTHIVEPKGTSFVSGTGDLFLKGIHDCISVTYLVEPRDQNMVQSVKLLMTNFLQDTVTALYILTSADYVYIIMIY